MAKDDLEKLIAAQREKLLHEALANGTVAKEDFDQLDRLGKLAAEGHAKKRRWLIPALALLAMAVVTFLLWKEQHETEVEMEATVSELSFRMPRKQPVMREQFLRALAADTLAGIVVNLDEQFAPPGETCSFNLELSDKPREVDSITVQSLAPPKDWRVRLIRQPGETQVRLTAPPKGDEWLPISVSLRGRAQLNTRCGAVKQSREINEAAPVSVTLYVGQETRFRLMPQKGQDARFARQIEWEDLILVDEETYQADTPQERQISSVVKGKLYLTALNGKPYDLRPSERLAFAASKGEIRTLSLATAEKDMPEGFVLNAHAKVQAMKAGDRSLMPNWLELLAAQSGLGLLWGSAIYLFGMAVAVLKYFRVTPS